MTMRRDGSDSPRGRSRHAAARTAVPRSEARGVAPRMGDRPSSHPIGSRLLVTASLASGLFACAPNTLANAYPDEPVAYVAPVCEGSAPATVFIDAGTVTNTTLDLSADGGTAIGASSGGDGNIASTGGSAGNSGTITSMPALAASPTPRRTAARSQSVTSIRVAMPATPSGSATRWPDLVRSAASHLDTRPPPTRRFPTSPVQHRRPV